jgi:hypothetical protein
MPISTDCEYLFAADTPARPGVCSLKILRQCSKSPVVEIAGTGAISSSCTSAKSQVVVQAAGGSLLVLDLGENLLDGADNRVRPIELYIVPAIGNDDLPAPA